MHLNESYLGLLTALSVGLLIGTVRERLHKPGEMMSCIKCGTHKPRATGSFRRFINANHFFCGECRVVSA